MEGKTSVVIAHHLDTVRHADIIFVFKDSELVERGTHEELLAAGGVYAELYRIQTSEDGERRANQPADD
jgi:ATP-binding cassette subfamily B protein